MYKRQLLPGLAFVGFLALVFALGFLVSMSGLLLEEVSFRLYPRWGQAARLSIAAVVENLGYRQLTAVWRLRGAWAALRRRQAVWGEMTRTGLVASAGPAPRRRAG